MSGMRQRSDRGAASREFMLGGKRYRIGPLKATRREHKEFLRRALRLQAALMAGKIPEDAIDFCVEIIWRAARQNHRSVTREEIADVVNVANVRALFQAALR